MIATGKCRRIVTGSYYRIESHDLTFEYCVWVTERAMNFRKIFVYYRYHVIVRVI